MKKNCLFRAGNYVATIQVRLTTNTNQENPGVPSSRWMSHAYTTSKGGWPDGPHFHRKSGCRTLCGFSKGAVFDVEFSAVLISKLTPLRSISINPLRTTKKATTEAAVQALWFCRFVLTAARRPESASPPHLFPTKTNHRRAARGRATLQRDSLASRVAPRLAAAQ
jgi:hypothetical protein